MRLLTRTTRSVSATEAGERLLYSVGPRLEEVETELDAISDLVGKPNGTVRITSTDYAVDTLLWPQLAPLVITARICNWPCSHSTPFPARINCK